MGEAARQRRSEEKREHRKTARTAAEVAFADLLSTHGSTDENVSRAFWSRLRELCDAEVRKTLSAAERLRRTADAFSADE